MLSSKKFKVLVAGCLVVLAGGLTGEVGWAKVIADVVILIVGYMGAQGLADFGKAKAGK